MRAPTLSALALLAACTALRPAPGPAPHAGAADPRALQGPQGWANGAVFYEVFVRSFQDSDGDGKGDLKGLIARLDYLNDGNPSTTNDLGVDALWLMPVFASPSYHGYDTTDYEAINPDYGSNEDFARLCAEAHKRGIKVVVDLVLNHTSSKHPWFVEAASSPSSPRRDWYVWSPTDLGWGQPWNPKGKTWHEANGAFYYGLFWRGMPDLNFNNPAVRAEARRIAALWLGRGVDGFRLDAARHLIETGPGPGQEGNPQTHAFWKEFAAWARSVKPEAVLIGENWAGTAAIAQYYGSTEALPGGDELPLNFDFPVAEALIESVSSGDAAPLAKKLAETLRTFPPGATDVPFLTNHDMRRVASLLPGEARLKSAAAVLLTLPGTPFLYYGEELGAQNGPGREDEWKRTPMAWDATPSGGFTSGKPWHPFAPGQERANVAAQAGDPGSPLSHYRRWIALRHASTALAKGTIELVEAPRPLLAFVRRHGEERVLAVHNLGDAPVEAALPVRAGGAEALEARGASLAVGGGGARVALPAHGSAAFRLEPLRP